VQNNQAVVSGGTSQRRRIKGAQDDALSFLKQQESLLKAGVIGAKGLRRGADAYKTAEARYNRRSSIEPGDVDRAVGIERCIAQSQAAVEQSQHK